jgi:archaellum component FlaC
MSNPASSPPAVKQYRSSTDQPPADTPGFTSPLGAADSQVTQLLPPLSDSQRVQRPAPHVDNTADGPVFIRRIHFETPQELGAGFQFSASKDLRARNTSKSKEIASSGSTALADEESESRNSRSTPTVSPLQHSRAKNLIASLTTPLKDVSQKPDGSIEESSKADGIPTSSEPERVGPLAHGNRKRRRTAQHDQVQPSVVFTTVADPHKPPFSEHGPLDSALSKIGDTQTPRLNARATHTVSRESQPAPKQCSPHGIARAEIISQGEATQAPVSSVTQIDSHHTLRKPHPTPHTAATNDASPLHRTEAEVSLPCDLEYQARRNSPGSTNSRSTRTPLEKSRSLQSTGADVAPAQRPNSRASNTGARRHPQSQPAQRYTPEQEALQRNIAEFAQHQERFLKGVWASTKNREQEVTRLDRHLANQDDVARELQDQLRRKNEQLDGLTRELHGKTEELNRLSTNHQELRKQLDALHAEHYAFRTTHVQKWKQKHHEYKKHLNEAIKEQQALHKKHKAAVEKAAESIRNEAQARKESMDEAMAISQGVRIHMDIKIAQVKNEALSHAQTCKSIFSPFHQYHH